MEVKLINYTSDALELLLGTKQTRLRGADPSTMSAEEKKDHFSYMLDTIKSSFEFVDYVFEISGVSKNCTHQLVRTRHASYQQEAGRALDLTGNGAVVPQGLTEEQSRKVMDAYADADAYYQELLAMGVARQDARAVLPSNLHTSIKAKYDLRCLSEMAKLRLCFRAQGEYQQVFRRMRELVIEVHPWAEPLLQVHCVALGTCAFPRWGKAECPVYDPRMDLDSFKQEVSAKFWGIKELVQANPVAHGGKAM
jgi:flavin-dependent thymidylate synthase